jgi:hypothetical protein
MNWGKIILVFQAGATLLIAIVLVSQVFVLEEADVPDLEGVNLSEKVFSFSNDLSLMKYRFEKAGYILTIVSLIELIIIWRLVS